MFEFFMMILLSFDPCVFSCFLLICLWIHVVWCKTFTMICAMMISVHFGNFWKIWMKIFMIFIMFFICSSFPANFHATFMFPADFPALACISLGFECYWSMLQLGALGCLNLASLRFQRVTYFQKPCILFLFPPSISICFSCIFLTVLSLPKFLNNW